MLHVVSQKNYGMFHDEIELRERERVALHDGRNACQKAAPRTE